MSNVKSAISSHNRRLLKQRIILSTNCPLNGKCLTESLVYKAEITATDVGVTKDYIEIGGIHRYSKIISKSGTSGAFKKRYANHKKSITNPRYSTESELSKYAWELKNKKRDFTINWSILKRVALRKAGGNSCSLCLEEKLSILEADSTRVLNKSSELFSKVATATSLAREILYARAIESLNTRAMESDVSENR